MCSTSQMKRKSDEISEKAQHKEAVGLIMEDMDETRKTMVAFNKLSGLEGVDVDPEGAVALLEESVENGDEEAIWMLGLCCEYGMGTEQDLERANLLYRNCHDSVGVFLHRNSRLGSGAMVVECSLNSI